MNNETLKPQEKKPQAPADAGINFSNLDESRIESLILARRELLESIKNKVGLKAYYAMEEKINFEEKRLREILDLKRGKQSRLAKYSLILNTNYFEQQFLN